MDDRPQRKRRYSQEIKQAAFRLFCDGFNKNEIANKLHIREECKWLHPSTIDNWIRKYGWVAKKREVEEELFARDIPKIAEEREKRFTQLGAILDNLADEAKEGKANGAEGATYAYVNALKARFQLMGENLDKNEKSGQTTVNIDKAVFAGELDLEELSKTSRRVDRMLKEGRILDADPVKNE